MGMDIEAALVRVIAPSDLADAIIGDLHERNEALAQTLGEAKALATCRRDVLRSLLPLLTYRASRALADNWIFALASAAVTCALCVATIPLWGHIGLGGAGYHLLRLAIIGLVLGCIPRASTLSCIFLLLLIGVSDWTIDARETGSGWHVLAEKKHLLPSASRRHHHGIHAHRSANRQIDSNFFFENWLAQTDQRWVQNRECSTKQRRLRVFPDVNGIWERSPLA